MIWLENFWGSFSYLGALYFAAYLVASRLERKIKKGPAALLTAAAVLLLAGTAFEGIYFKIVPVIMAHSQNNGMNLSFMSGLICTLIFLSAYIEVRLLFRCGKMEALFCASAGYCMQHLTQRFSSVINIVLLKEKSPFLAGVILTAVTVCFYLFVYYYIISDAHYNRIAVDGRIQILVSAVVILVTAILSSTGEILAERYGSWQLKVIIQLLCLLAAALALFLEFSIIFQKNSEYERDILSALMKENASQFEIQKNAIDAINVKCHDLKHQMQRLEQGVDAEYLKEMRDAVNDYDFVIHTGNEALDTVITMKSLTCENKGITFTFLGDGRQLSFISAADTYSLFGNMLDNAIEAVDAVANPDQKAIGLTIERRNGLILIHCENYYEQRIRYDAEGKPLTHKADKENHGFGIHSMQLLVEKYEGTLKFSDENRIFMIDIAFFGRKM